MTALETGMRRGRAYLQRCSLRDLAEMTLAQFCAIGRLDARQHYTRKKAQEEYALGWWNVGKQSLTLFKPDDHEQLVAEQEVETVLTLLEDIERRLGKLSGWREGVGLPFLQQALEGVASTHHALHLFARQIRSTPD